MPAHRRLVCALALMLLVLMACGGAAPQSVQTESYTLTLRMSGAGLDSRTVTLDIVDGAGQPVRADSVVLAPIMRDMGMASPEVTLQPSGAGQYTASGPFFSMLGTWELDVRVTAGGTVETAVFAVAVQ